LTYTPARILRNCSILHITSLGFALVTVSTGTGVKLAFP